MVASKLAQEIAAEIGRKGPITFARYMELCLYHPTLGYYSGGRQVFGRGGDFYTSSDVHAVFGRLLARQFEEMWELLGSPPRIDLVEFGAGRGLFLADLLSWTEKKFPDLYAAMQVIVVEQSQGFREEMRGRLAPHAERVKIEITGSLGESKSERSAPAILFANEFVDALPVEILDARGQVLVDFKNGAFVEMFGEPKREVVEYAEKYSVVPGQEERIEAGLLAASWMKETAGAWRRGFMVVIDYGYEREQMLRGRFRGTIGTFRDHVAGSDPYESPGAQDITAHVNFTALAATAEEAGATAHGLVTQGQFLMGIGEATEFADVLGNSSSPQEETKRLLQLKHLLTPSGLGESHQVMVLSKGVEKEKAALLSGLRFAKQPTPS